MPTTVYLPLISRDTLRTLVAAVQKKNYLGRARESRWVRGMGGVLVCRVRLDDVPTLAGHTEVVDGLACTATTTSVWKQCPCNNQEIRWPDDCPRVSREEFDKHSRAIHAGWRTAWGHGLRPTGERAFGAGGARHDLERVRAVLERAAEPAFRERLVEHLTC